MLFFRLLPVLICLAIAVPAAAQNLCFDIFTKSTSGRELSETDQWFLEPMLVMKNWGLAIEQPQKILKNDPRVQEYFRSRGMVFSGFYSRVLKEYGAWGEMLYKLGLTTAFPVRTWTKPRIIEAIQAISNASLYTHLNYVRLDPDGLVARLLVDQQINGAHPSTLVRAARSEFGSWDNARRAAGVPAIDGRANFLEAMPDKTEALRRILTDLAAIADLSHPTWLVTNPEVRAYFAEHIKEFGPVVFYRIVLKEYGTWNEGLWRLGFLTEMPTLRWTPERVIQAFQALSEAGLLGSIESIRRDPDGKIMVLLRTKGINGGLSSSGLWAAANAFFGGWYKAQIAAGVRTPVMEAVPWTVENILESIRVLYEGKFNLSENQMRQDSGSVRRTYLSEAGINNSSTKSLVREAERLFGSWRYALIKAGFIVDYRGSEWSREKIISVITELHEMSVPLNYQAVYSDPYGQILIYLRKRPDGGAPLGLLFSAVREFGSWDKALIQAGINPDYVRLRGMTPFQFLTEQMRAERGGVETPTGTHFSVDNDGNLIREVVADVNIEREYIQREQKEALDRALGKLELNDQRLFEEMVTEIESGSFPEMTPQTMPRIFATRIAQRLGDPTSAASLEARIQKLIKQLLADPEIRESLLESMSF